MRQVKVTVNFDGLPQTARIREERVNFDGLPQTARIREERAEISHAALIKLAFQIYRSNKLKTQERAFEEEGLIFNLRRKRGSDSEE